MFNLMFDVFVFFPQNTLLHVTRKAAINVQVGCDSKLWHKQDIRDSSFLLFMLLQHI